MRSITIPCPLLSLTINIPGIPLQLSFLYENSFSLALPHQIGTRKISSRPTIPEVIVDIFAAKSRLVSHFCLQIIAHIALHSIMGATQSIPVIGEVITVMDGAGRTIAAGALKVAQQHDAASKMIDSAGQTFVSYSERSAITSNVRRIFADKEESDRLLKAQGDAWTTLGESTPVVGHVVGAVRYAQGDSEGGDRCMINATRMTAIVGAAIATGGGSVAVATTVAAYDVIATGVKSGFKGEFKPVGYIDEAAQALKAGQANNTAMFSPLLGAAEDVAQEVAQEEPSVVVPNTGA